MALAAALGSREIEQHAIDVLVRDRRWVDQQFMEIMNAAGYGDRLIVPIFTTPPAPTLSAAKVPGGVRNTRLPVAEIRSRVRAPPGR